MVFSRRRATTQRRKPVRRKRVRVVKKASRKSKPTTATMTKIPDRMFTKLRYVQSGQTAVPRQQLFPLFYNGATGCCFASSLYLPYVKESDGTGAGSPGHQPYYFDQYKAWFTHYRVYGVKYDLTITNSIMNESWYAMVRATDTSTTEATATDARFAMNALCERPDTKFRQGGSVNGPRARQVIKGYMGVARTLGVSYKEVNEDDYYRASITGDPYRMAYLHAYLFSDHSSATITFDWTLRLTFYGVFEGRAAVGAS